MAKTRYPGLPRQAYPVGDSERGQVVQNVEPLTARSQAAKKSSSYQVTLSTTPQLIAPARSGRKRCLILNHDNAIAVYTGNGPEVSSTNGFRLGGLLSDSIEHIQAIWAVAASGTPVLSIRDEWDD